MGSHYGSGQGRRSGASWVSEPRYAGWTRPSPASTGAVVRLFYTKVRQIVLAVRALARAKGEASPRQPPS